MVIVITGANGFLGSHLVDQSIILGNTTIGLTRAKSDLSFLNHSCEHFSTDFGKLSLKQLLRNLIDRHGAIDLIIHNAGATRAKTQTGFRDVNVGMTKIVVDVLKDFNPNIKLAFVSSMAAKGPVGANGPVSEYGASKLEAEKVIEESGLSYAIFRPTAIYGPRDIQFLRLVKAVKMGVYPTVASRQKLTMVHVSDVARNILYKSLNQTNKITAVDDGCVYSHKELKLKIEKALNKKAININIPRRLAASFVRLEEMFLPIVGKIPSLTLEKFLEITQDWDHKNDNFDLDIRFNLDQGMSNTIEYYQKMKLI